MAIGVCSWSSFWRWLATVSPSATNPDITDPKFMAQYRPKKKAVFFRNVTTDAFQGPNMANYAFHTLKVKSVYVLDDAGAFGVGISNAFEQRASDIHVEPEEGGVAVRYRIDGVLRQVMKIPRQAGLPLISRIKIISSLDIADRLRPQDGRARVAVNGQPIDLRVSTLPAQLGVKVVIRILASRATVKSLDSLGLNPGEGEAIKRLLENHEGIILVTGPTGSGKTLVGLRAVHSRFLDDLAVPRASGKPPAPALFLSKLLAPSIWRIGCFTGAGSCATVSFKEDVTMDVPIATKTATSTMCFLNIFSASYVRRSFNSTCKLVQPSPP